MSRAGISTLRFEDHPTEPRGPHPPQTFTPMLLTNERIVSVETVEDAFGFAAARVWIERTAS